MCKSRVQVMYVNKHGELLLQFQPRFGNCLSEINIGDKHFVEPLMGGMQAEGEVARVTKSCVVMRNWVIV